VKGRLRAEKGADRTPSCSARAVYGLFTRASNPRPMLVPPITLPVAHHALGERPRRTSFFPWEGSVSAVHRYGPLMSSEARAVLAVLRIGGCPRFAAASKSKARLSRRLPSPAFADEYSLSALELAQIRVGMLANRRRALRECRSPRSAFLRRRGSDTLSRDDLGLPEESGRKIFEVAPPRLPFVRGAGR
jgi:hypothetical protein